METSRVASAMSSRLTPPSLSTATRSTRRLPAGVISTASTSSPSDGKGVDEFRFDAIPGDVRLGAAHGLRPPCAVVDSTLAAVRGASDRALEFPACRCPPTPCRVVRRSRRRRCWPCATGLAGCRWGPADDSEPQPTTSTATGRRLDDDTALAAAALAATNQVGPGRPGGGPAPGAGRRPGRRQPDAPGTRRPARGGRGGVGGGRPAAGARSQRDRARAGAHRGARACSGPWPSPPVGAASGSFARALASMSAAVAQQRTVLAGLRVGATP